MYFNSVENLLGFIHICIILLSTKLTSDISTNQQMNNAMSITCVRASALEWYQKNPKT